MEQVSNFVSFKELIFIVLASSGLLTLVFTIISRMFDKSSRVIIMDEIKKIDDKYQNKVDHIATEANRKISVIEGQVNEFRMNYLDRFAEQKDLIVQNKQSAEANHSETMQALVGIKGDIKHLSNNK